MKNRKRSVETSIDNNDDKYHKTPIKISNSEVQTRIIVNNQPVLNL